MPRIGRIDLLVVAIDSFQTGFVGDGRFGSSFRRNGQYLKVDLEGGCYVVGVLI